MLTPEYLEEVEFNKVVELYTQLNIDITADIIERVSAMGNITETTRKQLKILLETNGQEVFYEALNKTALLSKETKEALKDIYEDMAKQDIQGYKELYDYRDKPFKLSETQYKILNQGLKETNNTLNNLTKTIAFRSQQTYVEAVDRAYMEVVSGAIGYDVAINNIVQNLSDKGITLKDKLGRNVQLETAVRRNVMTGIQQTANKINRDVEDYLGCDGYEVSAHIGARPTHAEEQGKQFAVDPKDAKKYGIGVWKDVEDLWQEANCRHTYFGIILGISEPIYDKSELKEFKTAKISYKGKDIPYYEATQKQRALENSIRKAKRKVDILDKAREDTKLAKTQLAKANKRYSDFCKETGLQKEYGRIKTVKINRNNQQKYEDITSQFKEIKKYKIEEQKYYKDDNGNKYEVNGVSVIIKAKESERKMANILGSIYGGKVNLVPVVLNPKGIQTPDYIINNEKFDLKEISGNGKNTLDSAISKKKKQSNNFIFDISGSEMTEEIALEQINRIYHSNNRNWVNKIILIKDNKVLKIFTRK